MSHPPEPPSLDAALRAALYLLERAQGVRYAEVRYVDEMSERLRVRDGRPEQVTTTTSHGVAIRVLGAETWGFACTPSLSEGDILETARRAYAVAKASAPLAIAKVHFPPMTPSTGSYESAVAIDPFTVSLGQKLAALDGPVRALLAKGKPIRSAEAWMDWTRLHKRLLTTEGTDVRQTFTYGACGMQCIAIDDAGESQRRSYPTWQGGDGFQGGYERVHALDLLAHVDRIADEATALLTAPACPEGTRDLILESSQMALQIHESCGHPTELDRVMGAEISLAGGSFLQPDKLGKLRYGSPKVTLVADATTAGGMGTFGWDDEGVRAGKHPLVKDGMFVDYLSSRETAAALGRASTGTMRADGWSRTPLIRMINVSLEPSASLPGTSLDALIADTADGVFMETDKSWSIDDLRLDFQFSCEAAWEIKHGKRTRILRDPFYRGITPQFWRSCDAVCNESEWRMWGVNTCGKGDPMQMMQVGHGASPARFRNVTIGNSGRTT